jgi:hypothetical protein
MSCTRSAVTCASASWGREREVIMPGRIHKAYEAYLRGQITFEDLERVTEEVAAEHAARQRLGADAPEA